MSALGGYRPSVGIRDCASYLIEVKCGHHVAFGKLVVQFALDETERSTLMLSNQATSLILSSRMVDDRKSH